MYIGNGGVNMEKKGKVFFFFSMCKSYPPPTDIRIIVLYARLCMYVCMYVSIYITNYL